MPQQARERLGMTTEQCNALVRITLRGLDHTLLEALYAGAQHFWSGPGKKPAILEELKRLSQQQYVSPFDMAVVYQGIGDQDSAFEWFEQAYQQRVFRIIELTFPMFDNLRSDARWQDLVRRVGLPQ